MKDLRDLKELRIHDIKPNAISLRSDVINLIKILSPSATAGQVGVDGQILSMLTRPS